MATIVEARRSSFAVNRGCYLARRLLAGTLLLAMVARGEEALTLDSNGLRLELTASFGGRVIALHRDGRANIIKFNRELAALGQPAVDLDSDDVPYFGHALWIGPQSEWWNQQSLRPERRGAVWPPDPLLTLSATRVSRPAPNTLELTGPSSPVSGVQLTQRFAANSVSGGSIELRAEAHNIRDTPVQWDLWFNTRVHGGARIYAPVAGPDDYRVDATGLPQLAAPVVMLLDGLVSIRHVAAEGEAAGRQGKVYLRPAAGWMAAFYEGQLFIIEFDPGEAATVHPEHAQVEFYLRHFDADADGSFIEMELHAPYRHLPAGASMSAGERWRVLDYDGPVETTAEVAFLRQQLTPE